MADDKKGPSFFDRNFGQLFTAFLLALVVFGLADHIVVKRIGSHLENLAFGEKDENK